MHATHSAGALHSGLDLEMPRATYFSEVALSTLIDGSPDKGRWKTADATMDAATRVLTSMYMMKFDERPGCEVPCIEERALNVRTDEHSKVARMAATRSVVLLKNDGILPLQKSKIKRIAIVGPAAAAVEEGPGTNSSTYGGGGSSHVKISHVVTPLKAMIEGAQAAGITPTVSTDGRINSSLQAAKDVDAVVVVAAVTSSEGNDRKTLSLEGYDDLIVAMAAQYPTVVLMQTPGPVLTPWRDSVKGIANLFLAGEETASAWSAILFGNASPSGKLPVVFPSSEDDTIAPSSHRVIPYTEGPRISYRVPGAKPAFAFGHGLSYTKFEYESPKVVGADKPGWAAECVDVTIHNVGDYTGAEVAQAYLRFLPEKQEPAFVLRGFVRTRDLDKGDSEVVRFCFTDRDLSIWQVGQGWRTQQNVQVHVGSSSMDIRGQVTLRSNGRTSRARDAMPFWGMGAMTTTTTTLDFSDMSWTMEEGLPKVEGKDIQLDTRWKPRDVKEMKLWCESNAECVGFAHDGLEWYPKKMGTGFDPYCKEFAQKWLPKRFQYYWIKQRAVKQESAEARIKEEAREEAKREAEKNWVAAEAKAKIQAAEEEIRT